ncbi:hypothetical protein HYALB_00013528 [Hymenoscyphus albidus]|uniref:Uncharacterized protein n=1 Tax=Hymenoscyphus albidus TaxID=595503 RepID=A0A9N9LVK1_9HELO|nr:hypothetical protein HYALB_00013528 [Hymenoscyphus albidus]
MSAKATTKLSIKHARNLGATEAAILPLDNGICKEGAVSTSQRFDQKREAYTLLSSEISRKARTNCYIPVDEEMVVCTQSDVNLGPNSADHGGLPYNHDTVDVQSETKCHGSLPITFETPLPLELSKDSLRSTQVPLAPATQLEHVPQSLSSIAGAKFGTIPSPSTSKPIITTSGPRSIISLSLSQQYPRHASQHAKHHHSTTKEPCYTTQSIATTLPGAKYSPPTVSELFRCVGKVLIHNQPRPNTWNLLHVDSIMLRNLTEVFIHFHNF